MKGFGIFLFCAAIFAFDVQEQCREIGFSLDRPLSLQVLQEPFTLFLKKNEDKLAFLVELQAALLHVWIVDLKRTLEAPFELPLTFNYKIVLSLQQSLRIGYLKVRLFEFLGSCGFDVEEAIEQTLSQSSKPSKPFSRKFSSLFIGNGLSKLYAEEQVMSPCSLESIYLHWNLNLLMAQIIDPQGEKRHLKFIQLELKDSFFANLALIRYSFILDPKVKKHLKAAVVQMNYLFSAINHKSTADKISLFLMMEAKFITQLKV